MASWLGIWLGIQVKLFKLN